MKTLIFSLGVLMAVPSPMRRELLSWNEFDGLIDHLLPQFEVEFDALLLITTGGIVPGGVLAEALKQTVLFTASVDFPALQNVSDEEHARLRAWPNFLEFPADEMLRGRRVLVIDDVWGSGRTMTAVRHRTVAAGAVAYTCVLHFNPYRSLFGNLRPDYYAAITDAYIVYPWEISRGPDFVLRGL